MAEQARGRLAGKVAIITGAGSGIGRAMALLFAREGATVVAAGRTPASIEETVAMIRAETGREALAVAADVAIPADVERMVRETVARFGRIDILCNNAGIGSSKDVVAVEPDEWDRVFAVNVRGVYLGCKYALPHMLAQGGGSIINTASVLALVGAPERAAYCASKGAVVALTRQIAVEYADRGIRCNCLCPTTVDTPWVDRLLADAPDPVARRRALEERQPMGRLATAEDVAAAALYLASDDAAFVTGTAMVIDGGLSAR
ncbi:SDR family oxidoreductase [Sphaerobacter thermophilus]|uniref:SDR family oxidoreductase n=1 Tax=Sphaerobacter thermophilus TaxID=2057 RepID=UPI000DB4B2B3|nr:MAG: short-chain dehydrogenase [Sphaerobacter thermophilus]